jgi:hypothetical protein
VLFRSLAVFVVATLLSLRDAREEWRFPGLVAAQGAFAIERPYEAFVALGHISPGAAYLLAGDLEGEGSTWGGSQRWIEEQLIGTARASAVTWRADTAVEVARLDLGPGTRRWEGYSTLFGSIEVHALETPVTEFLVVSDRATAGITRFIDVRLLEADESPR